LCYGWRDFSKRSSFGNYREWLMVGWLYNSDNSIFIEGQKRFAEFADIAPLLLPVGDPNRKDRIHAAVEKRFYDFKDSWHSKLSKKYKIDYMVFEISKGVPLNLIPVYKNQHFAIYKSSDFK
jgi:hypothetical protein